MIVREVWLDRFSSSVCMCCKSAVDTSGWYEIFAIGVSLMNLLSLYLLVSRITSDERATHRLSWVRAVLSVRP